MSPLLPSSGNCAPAPGQGGPRSQRKGSTTLGSITRTRARAVPRILSVAAFSTSTSPHSMPRFSGSRKKKPYRWIPNNASFSSVPLRRLKTPGFRNMTSLERMSASSSAVLSPSTSHTYSAIPILSLCTRRPVSSASMPPSCLVGLLMDSTR